MSNNNTEEKWPYEVFSISPIPIYKTNIEREFTKQEQDEFDAIISDTKYDKSTYITKKISTDRYLLKRKSFLSIKSFIEQHLKEFITVVQGIDTAKTSWSPHITQSWLNIYEPNHFDAYHIHKDCFISGVLYINCLELPNSKTDGINFYESRHEFRDIELLPTKGYLHHDVFDKAYFVPVTEGSLILFPSALSHSVNLNETSDQSRISLSFNIMALNTLTGKINI